MSIPLLFKNISASSSFTSFSAVKDLLLNKQTRVLRLLKDGPQLLVPFICKANTGFNFYWNKETFTRVLRVLREEKNYKAFLVHMESSECYRRSRHISRI